MSGSFMGLVPLDLESLGFPAGMTEHGGASISPALVTMTAVFVAGLAVFPGIASLGYTNWHRRWSTTLLGRVCSTHLMLGNCMEALQELVFDRFPMAAA